MSYDYDEKADEYDDEITVFWCYQKYKDGSSLDLTMNAEDSLLLGHCLKAGCQLAACFSMFIASVH